MDPGEVSPKGVAELASQEILGLGTAKAGARARRIEGEAPSLDFGREAKEATPCARREYSTK